MNTELENALNDLSASADKLIAANKVFCDANKALWEENERLRAAVAEMVAICCGSRLYHFGTHTGREPQIDTDTIDRWANLLGAKP